MNKPSIHEKGQSGQAIVLIALTMIILLGAIGLAIDGGGMFLLYRDAQNAVDSASLSAAFALCTDDDPIAQAYRTLDLNGFDPTDAGVTITVNRPPQNTGNPDYENDNHLQIILNAEKPSYFIQAVYQGPLVINVEAISFCEPGSPDTSASIENRYAFRSLREPDECQSSVAWDLAGSNFTLEGDVWMPNVTAGGKDSFSTENTPNRHTHPTDHPHTDRFGDRYPLLDDNNIDILGNIYIGGSQTEASFLRYDSGTVYWLNEDFPESTAGDAFNTTYGGDGVISFADPAEVPPPLDHTMDYYRPDGSLLCDNPTGSECGALNREHGTMYRDVSYACDHGAINNQDFGPGGTLETLFNGGNWEPGIYYATCKIQFDFPEGVSVMNGNISWVSENVFDLSPGPYNFTSYEDVPFLVTNYNSSGPQNGPVDVNNCSNGGYAVQLNADHSNVSGPIIAFRGIVEVGGNYLDFRTCISAAGIKQNGNTDSIYRCVPGQDGFAPGSYGQRE